MHTSEYLLGETRVNDTIEHKLHMDNGYKAYVDVNEVHLKDGRIFPISFVWEDGSRYNIERIIEVCHAASLKAGGAGIRYTVRTSNCDSYMFLEGDSGSHKWFMERKGR